MSKTAFLIDYEYCSGCKSCELACKNELGLDKEEWGIKVLEDGPRQHSDGSWHWNYVPHMTALCDGCAKRMSEDRLPSCVQHCLARVIEYGSPDDMLVRMKSKGEKIMLVLP